MHSIIQEQETLGWDWISLGRGVKGNKLDEGRLDKYMIISKPIIGKDPRECFVLLVHMAVRDIDRDIRVSSKG